MNRTSIEWTHRPQTGGEKGGFTWNPIRARLKDSWRHAEQARTGEPVKPRTGTFCTRISPGCQHCYASIINKRFGTGLEYTVPNLDKHEFYIDQRILEEPLKRKKPATIFSGDMYDAFHESVSKEFIDKTLAVVALSEHHIFQFLTKRAARMQSYFSSRETPYRIQRQIDILQVEMEMREIAECWASIPGYEGHYEISNYGNIRSKTMRPLSPIDDHKGYLRAALSKEGAVRQFFVHRLVLAAFVGESDEECCHRNGIGTDNRIANLSYGPASDNAADRSRHGTAGAWMKSEAPLSDSQVEDIRQRRMRGEKLKDIEASTGVDRRKISQIATGKTYKTASLVWPLPNLWFGVSVESQKYADERIPLLLQTPAAIRFLSVEPMLEWVDIRRYLKAECVREGLTYHKLNGEKINWVIVGGESGPGARAFDLRWAESLRDQCKEAGVAFFMKQIGSHPNSLSGRWSKGGVMDYWPIGLRVREFPA